MTPAQTLRVVLDGKRDYDIIIGPGVLQQAGKHIGNRFGRRRMVVLCDPGAATHLPLFLKSFSDPTPAQYRILDEGEATKTFAALENTLNWLLDQHIDRDTLIIAFGGGVAGDHAGFAAAIALRGLDYVQIPTTLLAQVDSSVGGKTGINTAKGKNLVGAFHQPRLVMADTTTLDTLPDREMRAGYAEIAKYAFIDNRGFFDWLEDNGSKVLARDEAALVHAITVSCKSKADIVASDEHEASTRALLNFGHTFGHALEAACRYDRKVLHGEAVSIGMCIAFDVSRRMGLCPEEDVMRAFNHLNLRNLPTRISDIEGFPNIDADGLVELMANDKKAKFGRLTFILSRGIGKAFVTRDVDPDAVKAAMKASLRSL